MLYKGGIHDKKNIKAKILWTELGIVSKEAASLGKKAGLLVVMDECPKIILENSDCTNSTE